MINTDDMTKEERAEYWEMVMEDFSGSNKTKTDYCKENDIPISTFNYWVNRLEELRQLENIGKDRFIELPQSLTKNRTIKIDHSDPVIFIPEIAIDYDGIRILLNTSTPMTLLSSVMKELGNA